IQERFPRYYRYFSTRSFTWHGHEIANHNHLLGTVEGVDGIKTGFVHASGFNLVTSVRRNGRHLVAVVMGGSSAGSRDSRMRELISQYISKGSTQHTAAAIPEGARSPVRAAAKMATAPDGSMAKTADAPFVTASAGARAAPAVQPIVAQPATTATDSQPAASRHLEATVAMVSPLVGSSDDIRPTPVRTLRVRATTIKATSIGSEPEAAHAVVPVTPAATDPQPEAESVTAAPSTAPTPPAPPVAAARAPAPPAQRAPPVVVARAPAPPVADVVPGAVAPPVAAAAPLPAVAEALEAKPPKIFATASAPAPAKQPAVVTEVAAAPAPVPAAQDVRDAKAPKASATAPTPIPAKPAVVAEAAAAQRSADSTEGTPAHEGATRDGWLIQVGALESVTAAKARLRS